MGILLEIQEQAPGIRAHLPSRQYRLAQRLRQGPCCDDETVGGNDRLAQAGPKIIGIAIGRQDHSIGDQFKALRGGQAPALPRALQSGCPAMPVDAGPLAQGGTRQPSCIAEGLQAAGAWIDPAAQVIAAADPACNGGLVQQLHVYAPLPPLRGTALDGAQGGGRRRWLDPTFARSIAIDGVPPDKVEDFVGGGARDVDQRLGASAAKQFMQLVRVVFQAGDHLATVASGGPPAGFASI
ncbi:hypothetical protein D9M68_432340 [compost metagenome]